MYRVCAIAEVVAHSSPQSRKDARNRNLIRELKKGDRVNVKIAPMCIFLFRDGKHENHSPITVAEKLCLGTVITIHQDTKLNLTAPITGRLRQRDTGLRSTADASLLVESLLDLGAYASICLGRRQCSWSLGGQADETLHPRVISGRSGT